MLYSLDKTWQLLDWIVDNDCLNEALPWLLSGKFNPFEGTDIRLASEYYQPPKKPLIYLKAVMPPTEDDQMHSIINES